MTRSWKLRAMVEATGDKGRISGGRNIPLDA
jgi:hypothetical protein